MLTLIGEGGRNAHPAYWAPIIVVGGNAGIKTIDREIVSAPSVSDPVPAKIIPPLPQRVPAVLRAPPPVKTSPPPPPSAPDPDDWASRVFQD
jgi:hypothetical protein